MIHITLYSVLRTSYSVLTAGFLPSTEDPPLRGKKKKKREKEKEKEKRLSATSAEDDRNWSGAQKFSVHSDVASGSYIYEPATTLWAPRETPLKSIEMIETIQMTAKKIK